MSHCQVTSLVYESYACHWLRELDLLQDLFLYVEDLDCHIRSSRDEKIVLRMEVNATKTTCMLVHLLAVQLVQL